jgi:ABC-type uncharacterized transport system permease subunit
MSEGHNGHDAIGVRGGLTNILIPFLAVGTALVLGAIIIYVSGASVREAYGGLFEGMLGSRRAISETLVASTPYILLGLGVALGFRCGLFNIGAEGQFFIGALFSAVAGFGFQGLPAIIHLPLALTCGIIGGAIWGGIPGWLKARFGAHEVINTIMMNYAAVALVDYLVKNVFRDSNASLDRTPFIAESAKLPRLMGADYRIHAGLILALVLSFLLYWFLKRTRKGFEIRTVGLNPEAARYAGMNPGRLTVIAMAMSGGLAGLAGSVEVLGLNHNLPAAFSSGYGFDAIAVALLARSNPIAVIPAALLWGGLRNGAGLMQLRSGISLDMINVIQALVLVFIAADPVIRFLYRLKPAARQSVVFSKTWSGQK